MAKRQKINPHPYVTMRLQGDGSVRPRFTPGPRQRALGYKPHDLKHRDGAWFSYGEACLWAKAKAGEIDEAREVGRAPKAPRARPGSTVEDLLEDFLRDLKKKIARGDVAQSTWDGLRKAANAVIFRPETRAEAKLRRQRERAAQTLGQKAEAREKEPFAQTPVTAIGAPELRNLFDYAREKRGHRMAVAMIGVISWAWTWATEQTRWRLPPNPRLGMKFDKPAGRVMLIELHQFRQMVAAADLIGRPSIGHSWFLGLWTGQRQNDRRYLTDGAIDDQDRQVLQQSKTGVRLRIKRSPQLAQRLEQARIGNAALKLAKGTTKKTDCIVKHYLGRDPERADAAIHRLSEFVAQVMG